MRRFRRRSPLAALAALATGGALTLGSAVAVAGLAVGTATSASAGVNQGALVSTNPADFTPNINNGAVYAMVQIGSTMYVGGDFTSVRAASGGAAVTRRGLVAFNAKTGAISSFAPVFNGAVNALTTDGKSLYAGGSFTTVAGVARPYLVKLTSGHVDTAFNARLNRKVSDSKLIAGRLIVAGDFSGALRAVSPSTGANTGYINLDFRSTFGADAGAIGITRFAINSQGIRLVAVGNFTAVGGQKHIRAVMVNLGTTATTVNAWYYAGLEKTCELTAVPNYLRGVDFSPDGTYFVLVGTGQNPQTAPDQGIAVCDAAARFETGVKTPSVPTWINYTGRDTILAVNITDAAVYVQGHFRWLNNEGGDDAQGPNGLDRPGIGALDNRTGRALSWNPGKDRGIGGKVLLTTSAGLWVGSDTTQIGGETRARIALLPI